MIWHVYFLSKILFAMMGAVTLYAVANFALAMVCYWPIQQPRVARWRNAAAVAVGLALLVAEGTLPGWKQWPSALNALSQFSAHYWVELLWRLGSMPAALAWLGLVAMLWLFSRRYRVELWVLLLLIGMTFPMPWLVHRESKPAGSAIPAASAQPPAMETFSKEQSELHMTSVRPPTLSTPDLAFIHVCSLGWDDMRHVGFSDAQFTQMFDVVLGQFNSVSSYSGPSMLRLVHGACGQLPHGQLYGEHGEDCNLLQAYAHAGYGVQAWLNHNGRFDQFGTSLQANSPARIQTVDDFTMLGRKLQAFDGSDLVDDEALLEHWWQGHEPQGKARVLYYNTISLHDGNRALARSGAVPVDYQTRLRDLMQAIQKLVNLAKGSSRGLVLVLIPEHGAALRPQGIEIAGMRNSPWPTITHVPVGVRVVNASTGIPHPVLLQEPTSYLSLTTLIAGAMAAPRPLEGLQASVEKVPPVPWIADNGDRQVAWHQHTTWVLNAQDKWNAVPGIRAIELPEP